MTTELLGLLQEYYDQYLKSIPPDYRDPINTNQLSFYGFFRWLEHRETLLNKQDTPSAESTDVNPSGGRNR